MKGILAVLLVLTMFLVTPAHATAVSPEDQNFDPMNVKGKGVDVGASDELLNQNSVKNASSTNETSNSTIGTLYTDEELSSVNITDDNRINTVINSDEDFPTSETPNQENLTETTSTEQPVSDMDNDTENSKPLAENETITVPVLNTTGIVMQTSNYTCGPAALATVLNNMGINATEQELAVLAGTDENGTIMYGLIQAAWLKE